MTTYEICTYCDGLGSLDDGQETILCPGESGEGCEAGRIYVGPSFEPDDYIEYTV